jgi:hypothetical protein
VSTGDPELDRAARIDIGRLRSERGIKPPSRGEAGPPRAGRSREAGPPPRQVGPPPSREASAAPTARSSTPVRDQGEKKKSRPLYKEWWFWTAAAVGAIVLYVIVTSDSDSSDERARFLPFGDAQRSAGEPGGAVLLRF